MGTCASSQFFSMQSAVIDTEIRERSSNLNACQTSDTSVSILTSHTAGYSNLLEFAEGKLFIDDSRRSVLEYNGSIIKDLDEGKLKNRNRFRCLLLGSKSCGKSALLEVLGRFVHARYPNIVVVKLSVGPLSPTCFIQEIFLKVNRHLQIVDNEFLEIIQDKNTYDQIIALEKLLNKNHVKVLLLIDEFHNVYCRQNGGVLLEQLYFMSDSSAGMMHIVVTGSSTVLRKLAFCKPSGLDMNKYPSYTNCDLNSTKLQPAWIYPLRTRTDMLSFLKRYCPHQSFEDDRDFLEPQFIFSGGRPGLLLEQQKDVVFSIHGSSLSKDSQVLASLLNVVDVYSDDADGVFTPLIQVPFTVLYERFREQWQLNIEEYNFKSLCYDLSDAGIIILTGEQFSTIGFSCFYVYYVLKAGNTVSFSWKEAAALKYPYGLFDKFAEDVALRIIRQNYKSINLFGGQDLRYTESSCLCFGKNSISSQATRNIQFLTSDQSLIFDALHKELSDGKDKHGADGIFLYKINEQQCGVIRVQLKLKCGTITKGDVEGIKNDMATRGNEIILQIQRRFSVARYTNILLTTQFFQNDNEVKVEERSMAAPGFLLISRNSLHQLWPPHVLMLGEPYGSNRLFHSLLTKSAVKTILTANDSTRFLPAHSHPAPNYF